MLLDASSRVWAVIPLLMAADFVSGKRTGAPDDACQSMTPGGHYGSSAQTSTAPYTVQLSQAKYKAGASIDVTISGKGTVFKGFLLQARSSDGGTDAYGSFTNLPSEARAACITGGAAATHTSNTEKESITVRWTAPDPAVGQVVFRATVVESFDVWWENVLSVAVDEDTSSSDNESSTRSGTGDNDMTPEPSDSEESTTDGSDRVTEESVEKTTTGGVRSCRFNIALLAALGTLVLMTTKCL